MHTQVINIIKDKEYIGKYLPKIIDLKCYKKSMKKTLRFITLLSKDMNQQFTRWLLKYVK